MGSDWHGPELRRHLTSIAREAGGTVEVDQPAACDGPNTARSET